MRGLYSPLTLWNECDLPRPAFIFLLIALPLISVPLHAQVQEERMARILDPDQTKGVREQDKVFYGGREFQGTSSANVKSFPFLKLFAPRTYETRDFYGTKRNWFSSMLFHTKEANTTPRLRDGEKKADTKTADTKNARESTKTYATDKYATREYPHRGRNQDRFDKEGDRALSQGANVGWQGEMKTMSMDEVRELLNKPPK
jgi:hypothetical protein